MYNTIRKYNDQNHTPLSNVNIREVIDQVTREEKAEANNVTVDTFIQQINDTDNIINEVKKFTINDVQNNLINEVANLTINDVRKNIINEVANLKINDVGKNLIKIILQT